MVYMPKTLFERQAVLIKYYEFLGQQQPCITNVLNINSLTFMGKNFIDFRFVKTKMIINSQHPQMSLKTVLNRNN